MGCSPWRVAAGLNKLLHQIDLAAPGRSKASDGSIGDTAHQSGGACSSEHNCGCVMVGGVWIIRARDFTHDPARGANMAVWAERLRQSRDRRIRYVIFAGRITGPNHKNADGSWRWDDYDGSNDHSKHMHVSTWNDQARFDDISDWPIGATPGVPGPPVPVPVDWRSILFRSLPVLKQGDNNRSVKKVQALASALGYSLAEDGNFGSGTKAKIQAFQRSRGLGADGIVGEKTWRALAGGLPILRAGSKGTDVKRLQALLNLWGKGIREDADFGAGTHNALASVQREGGVPGGGDGVAGDDTWRFLLTA
jgi:hypothetical protein